MVVLVDGAADRVLPEELVEPISGDAIVDGVIRLEVDLPGGAPVWRSTRRAVELGRAVRIEAAKGKLVVQVPRERASPRDVDQPRGTPIDRAKPKWVQIGRASCRERV